MRYASERDGRAVDHFIERAAAVEEVVRPFMPGIPDTQVAFAVTVRFAEVAAD